MIAAIRPTLAAGLIAVCADGAGAQSLPQSVPASSTALVAAPDAFIGACDRYPWLCTVADKRADAPGGSTLLDLIRQINSTVNGTISPLTDSENYGTAEFWTLPQNGYGDCEDYALEKFRRLVEAGVGSVDMRLAIVLDRQNNNHVVLIVRHEGTDLVLDSLTGKIKPWNRTPYTYLATQIGGSRDQWEVVVDRSRDSELLARL